MLGWLMTVALAQQVPHAERMAAAEAGYALALEQREHGLIRTDDVCLWSVRWFEAARDAGRADAATLHVARMATLQGQVEKDFLVGVVSNLDRQTARYCLAEAQVWAAGAPKR